MPNCHNASASPSKYEAIRLQQRSFTHQSYTYLQRTSLLVAPGLTTRNKKLLGARVSLLVTKSNTTSSILANVSTFQEIHLADISFCLNANV